MRADAMRYQSTHWQGMPYRRGCDASGYDASGWTRMGDAGSGYGGDDLPAVGDAVTLAGDATPSGDATPCQPDGVG